jgi:hypothetical protein
MLREIDQNAIAPAMLLLPMAMDSPRAHIQLLAMGLQESALRYRVQHMNGPAHGLWMFERGGGVRGVLEHPSTCAIALNACEAHHVTADAQSVWEVLPTDDVLAAAFARLFLWTDAHNLPNDAQGGWLTYLRTWRPGRPRPDTWPAFYAQAEDWVLRGVDS